MVVNYGKEGKEEVDKNVTDTRHEGMIDNR